MKSNRSNAIAILLALTMTASALAGCTGTDDDVGDEPVELQDWGVYSVQSSSAVSYTHLTLPTILLV